MEKIIEIAKQKSKEDFLKFVTGIYGVDESLFEHIWKVPIISSLDNKYKHPYEKINSKAKSILKDVIDGELGDNEGCMISFSKIDAYFSEDELEEINKLRLDHNAIIVYNEPELINEYKEMKEANSKKENPEPEKSLQYKFIKYVKEIITHERCHLNANYLFTDVDNDYVESSELNGAEADLADYEKGIDRICDYQDRNEVLIDTLSQMMSNYEEGNTIQDCLYKVIKDRKGKSRYKDLDDREVLTMYALFPEKLTKWVTFGAYEFTRENELKKELNKVCGTDELLDETSFKNRVKKYIETFNNGELSSKQIEMLKMLGIDLNKKIEMPKVDLNSKYGELFDIKKFVQNRTKSTDEMER